MDDTYHRRPNSVNASASAATPASELRLDAFLCFAIYSAGHALTRFYKPLLRDLGLTYPQYLTMVELWENDNRTVGSIAERLLLESHTVTPLVRRLETMGHVKRTRGETDERETRIALTRKGRLLRVKATGVPGCLRAAIDLDDKDLATLHAGLIGVRETVLRKADFTSGTERRRRVARRAP